MTQTESLYLVQVNQHLPKKQNPRPSFLTRRAAKRLSNERDAETSRKARRLTGRTNRRRRCRARQGVFLLHGAQLATTQRKCPASLAAATSVFETSKKHSVGHAPELFRYSRERYAWQGRLAERDPDAHAI